MREGEGHEKGIYSTRMSTTVLRTGKVKCHQCCYGRNKQNGRPINKNVMATTKMSNVTNALKEPVQIPRHHPPNNYKMKNIYIQHEVVVEMKRQRW